MMKCNWQHPDWPQFVYDPAEFQDSLYGYLRESSALAGGFSQLLQSMQLDTLVDFMVAEALNTSRIEGEIFDPEQIRSSIKNALGLSHKRVQDPSANGIGQMMVDVQKNFENPLSKEMLLKWHSLLMSGSRNLDSADIGAWRSSKEPMQVVSGPIGHEKIHFEAPPSVQVDTMMFQFVTWYNQSGKLPGPVRAALAHLYFESIHPFEDGNGRIGRAIAEKALAQDLKHPPLLSLSQAIQRNKKEYYQQLSIASQYTVSVSKWVSYFVRLTHEAQLEAKAQVSFVLKKSQFWQKVSGHINTRQEKMFRKMFSIGYQGFEGGMTAQKYVKITDCSKATATRDLAELLNAGWIKKLPGSGRSSHYEIIF